MFVYINNNFVYQSAGGTAIHIFHNVYMDIQAVPLLVSGGRRSPAVACWASDHWVASSNPLRGKFRH